MSAATIHKIEQADMVPTITTLLKIAAALDRPVSYFVEDDDEDLPTVLTKAESRRPIYTSHAGIDLAGITGPYGEFLVAAAVATLVGEKGRAFVVELTSGSRAVLQQASETPGGPPEKLRRVFDHGLKPASAAAWPAGAPVAAPPVPRGRVVPLRQAEPSCP